MCTYPILRHFPIRLRQRRLTHVLSLALLSWIGSPALAQQQDDAPQTFAQRIDGLDTRPGLFTLHVDTKAGKVLLELPAPDETGRVGQYLYVESLVTGLGSNPVGLDRGQLGDARVVNLRTMGDRLFIEQPNLRYRANTDNESERRAVHESFASSILWAGKIDARADDGRLLIDITGFIARDAHGVVRTLKRTEQGAFHLDDNRSAVDTANCLAFPDNIVLDAILTFASDEPGPLVRQVAPSADSVTLTQRHMFVRLPDDDYKPRAFDPHMPSFPITFMDFATPINKPIETRWIARHRLEKTDPTAARSPVKKPIVYYIDPGAPEPIRSALVEGVSWWAQAFEAAGFENAFRVEVAPPDINPLDVRYNYVQWVHRSTRGWSYGGSIIDPRTGEIIKGHVSLGSLRVRQDRLIFEGLLGADGSGKGGPNDPVQLALARIRQLGAHEVGHTLGFAHNFAASAYGGRASVMDYPAPMVTVRRNGSLDVSGAYAVGIGSWDKKAVEYAYSQFPPGVNERDALASIVRDATRKGMLFLTDADARPAGAADPRATLWDNGDDPVAALTQILRVRQVALKQFGERNIAPGQPLATLQETFAPLYLFHRYQLNAAVKVVGGALYNYAVRGDGQPGAKPIDGARQRRALQAVLTCIDPATLDIPERALEALAPRPYGYPSNRELFASDTAPTFDFLGATQTAANFALSGLLQPQRAARLAEQHARNPAQPGLRKVIDDITKRLFDAPRQEAPRRSAIRRATQSAFIARLLALATNQRAADQTIAVVDDALADLRQRLDSLQLNTDLDARAHTLRLIAEITRHLERPRTPAPSPAGPAAPPPGQPIGTGPAWIGVCEDDWFAPVGR